MRKHRATGMTTSNMKRGREGLPIILTNDQQSQIAKESSLDRWLRILENKDEVPETWEAFADNGRYDLSKFESHIFMCGLEKTIDEFLSLSRYDAKPPPPLPDIKKPSNVKTYITHKHIYDRNTLLTKREQRVRYQNLKIQDTRRFIERAMSQTNQDLNNSRTFTRLQETLGYLKLRRHERKVIFRDKQELDSVLRTQNATSRVEKFLAENLATSKDTKLVQLRSEVHDQSILSAVRARTVAKHEASRREQNAMKLYFIESGLQEKADKCRHDIAVDSKVNSEIVQYLTQKTEAYKANIIQWSELYDLDIEAYDTTLLMKKEALEILQEDLARLKVVYNDRQFELESYLQVKHSKELIVRRTMMALALQSWWRSLAFRKNLGAPLVEGKKGKRKIKKRK